MDEPGFFSFQGNIVRRLLHRLNLSLGALKAGYIIMITGEEVSMNKVFGPRNFRAHLRETYEIYRKNFSILLAIAVIGEGPIFLLGSISGKTESTALLIAVGLIALCCLIVNGPLMIGALIHAVSEQFFRQTISIRRSYNFTWKRLATLIGSTLLAIILAAIISFVIGGAIFFLLGLIGIKIGMFLPVILLFATYYFIVCWSFIWEAALLEGLSSKAAVSRSFALVKGNWWRVGGMMLVMGIIISTIINISGIIPGIGRLIGSILSTPFFVIGHVLLYYDLRLRKEGYSVDTLAGELNIKPDLRFTKASEDLSNEAFTLYQQGQFSEAAKRLQEALKAAENAIGPEHLDVATILNNLALIYQSQGKYADAQPLYRRSLEIKEKALGSDHPDMAITCENMAKLYKKIGKEDEAKRLEARARRIRPSQ
jgi:tetratricopeptide (TPR) repeat protein